MTTWTRKHDYDPYHFNQHDFGVTQKGHFATDESLQAPEENDAISTGRKARWKRKHIAQIYTRADVSSDERSITAIE
jgi:hypothetical protein